MTTASGSLDSERARYVRTVSGVPAVDRPQLVALAHAVVDVVVVVDVVAVVQSSTSSDVVVDVVGCAAGRRSG